jgi:transcriptional regulator with XRE-family HTH domain
MNLIRLLRLQTGTTQQELAVAAGTSQSTIAAYEAGSKSPTLRTINNLTKSLGLVMITTYMPRLTREDKRSLAFHRAIVEILRKTPAPVLSRATKNLKKLSINQPGARMLFERWKTWLKLPLEELVSNLLDPLPVAREMRQVSPFSGVLKAADRTRILRQFRKEQES